MTFSKSIIGLGEGRPLWAREREGGIGVVSKNGVALIYRVLPKNSTTAPSTGEVISYADECFMLDKGKMHKRGGLEYELY